MIKIAIVEDDVASSDELKTFFSRYQIEANVPFEVNCFSTADKFLSAYRYGKYQMVFMDIEMPGTDGMEAAKILRQKDADVLLFFVTNLSQYALESYEVQAFNFMVKPITYSNFFMKMERAVQRVLNDSDSKIILSLREDDRVMEKIISISDIRFVEVLGHQIIYHTVEGDVAVRDGSMKAVKAKLEHYGFSMCNQSYLVNMKYITAVDKDDVYVGDDVIKIARRRRADFLSAVAKRLSSGRVKK